MYRTIIVLTGVLLTALGLAACVSRPSNLDLSLTRPSTANKFVVALQAPDAPAAINQIHSWHIKLTTPAGVPISHAHIAVDGGMPEHGHGLPTQPQVTQELGGGVYLLEGMKFSMSGWWEIKLAIDTADASDKVTFNTLVATPSVTR